MNTQSDTPGPLPSAFQRSLTLLEHKRRLVSSSSPQTLALDLASSTAPLSSSPVALSSSSFGIFPSSAPLLRRTRSRHATRTPTPSLPTLDNVQFFPVSPTSSLVPLLTPTTEEWHSLGLDSAPQDGDIDHDAPPSPDSRLLLARLNSISLEQQHSPSLPLDLPPRYDNARSLYNPAITPEPSLYSGFSREYSISDFIVYQDAGKGAYGLVKRARLKGPTGDPIGPHLIIKYIYKQRILADCWQYHRTLGTIPVEVHVLEYLSRIYTPISRNHPNICGMYDFFEDPDHYYLIMPKFGTGKDLFDHVEMNPYGLPIDEIISICRQVSAAIAFLHQNRIVHRDIKDENVILDGAGGVQLIDFGSATYYREGQLFDTFSGTLDFMAPEVVRRERYGGKEIDVWALGILFYVVLCGEMPFHAQEALSGLVEGGIPHNQMMSRITQAKIRDESEAQLISDFVDLTMRCLELDPAARPSAAAVLKHRVFSYPLSSNAESSAHTALSSSPTNVVAAYSDESNDNNTPFIASNWIGPRGWLKQQEPEEPMNSSNPSEQTTPTAPIQQLEQQQQQSKGDGADRSSSISLVSSLSSISSLSSSSSSSTSSSTASPSSLLHSPTSPTSPKHQTPDNHQHHLHNHHLAHPHTNTSKPSPTSFTPDTQDLSSSPSSPSSLNTSPTSTTYTASPTTAASNTVTQQSATRTVIKA